MVPIHDLSADLASMTARAGSQEEFDALFRNWLAGQEAGPLGPLLEDSARWNRRPSRPRS